MAGNKYFAPDPWTRLVGVSWTTGGLVYICYSYTQGISIDAATGKETATSATPPAKQDAIVRNFPVKNFETFSLLADSNNIVGKDGDKVQHAEITDPITVEMLQKWATWTPHAPYDRLLNQTKPGLEVWIIDNALFYGVYKNMDNGQVAYGTKANAEQEMYNGYQAFYGNIDRDRFGSHLADHLEVIGGRGFMAVTPGPPDPVFFQVASQAQPPWTYHTETGPPYTNAGREGAGVLMINTAKVRSLMPSNRAADKDFTFQIDIPNNENLDKWRVAGAAFKLDKTGRKTFPLDSKLKPLFPMDVEVSGTRPADNTSVAVKITFNPPKVELKASGGTSGPPTAG